MFNICLAAQKKPLIKNNKLCIFFFVCVWKEANSKLPFKLGQRLQTENGLAIAKQLSLEVTFLRRKLLIVQVLD